MAQKKYRKRTGKISNKASVSLHLALENLKERLSSPRLKAPGTIYTYLRTARNFLTWLGDGKIPDAGDFRRYFIYRREQGISERTLTKEFYQLKKLALSNGWDWPFEADDVPYSEEEPRSPALRQEDVEKLIMAQHLLSKSERFFLAVSTTWGCRREELRRIVKRDYDEESILIRTAKHGRRVRHLIPEVLKPIFEAYRPKEHGARIFSEMFIRICRKADVKIDRGYSFHSIRRTLRTLGEWALAANKVPMSLWADYQGWSRRTKGVVYGGAAMLGVYSHPEILSNDPFAIDRIVYPIHPFLPVWGKALAEHPLAEEKEESRQAV
jgi:integrase